MATIKYALKKLEKHGFKFTNKTKALNTYKSQELSDKSWLTIQANRDGTAARVYLTFNIENATDLPYWERFNNVFYQSINSAIACCGDKVI
jgi:DNA-binding PadR family transcriptional regulator